MHADPQPTYTTFVGPRRLASGSLGEVALAVLRRGPSDESTLVFSDLTGDQVELDLRGGERGVAARYGLTPAATATVDASPARSRGRPRMGVVAREVTLLPAHWEWLAAEPGGASVVLRKLVHQAMRAGAGRERLRRAQERSYKVMVALAGNRAGFEDAARALFAADTERLRSLAAAWPRDVREQVLRLADPDHEGILPSAH